MKRPKTLVIATGGTIDSAYDPTFGTPVYVPTPKTSAIPYALKELGWKDEDFHFEYFYHEDSQHLHQQQMHTIAHYLKQHPEYDKVIITHGTDTAPRNGRYLSELMDYADGSPSRTIIFCGAMKPLRMISDSAGDVYLNRAVTDGWGNLELAMKNVHTQPPGVYLTDGHTLHDVFHVEKRSERAGDKVTNARFVGYAERRLDPSTNFVRDT